ncbi:hypothetical protein [Paraburkholderia solisilvae]|uniref:Uncharacterized protein n=1 Tax=Paraburkholderia solisilvae TaxID=624376 RepID=A0A6J5DP06_9BURK|nr:hypothetical protein [Paraburkholderia solisilvae]CAB3755673.1 hypothetical protein LMG29739_02241 [Paraburkholderia solisilvae]
MYQPIAKHPLSPAVPAIDDDVFASMWDIFVNIGKFWGNMDDATPHRAELYSFMLDRIRLRPIYGQYYANARDVMRELIREFGSEAAYTRLFTDKDANRVPAETPLAVVRQMVSNEFIALQLCLGGFKASGAVNYCGYIGGPNIPGAQTPYRTPDLPSSSGAEQ